MTSCSLAANFASNSATDEREKAERRAIVRTKSTKGKQVKSDKRRKEKLNLVLFDLDAVESSTFHLEDSPLKSSSTYFHKTNM